MKWRGSYATWFTSLLLLILAVVASSMLRKILRFCSRMSLSRDSSDAQVCLILAIFIVTSVSTDPPACRIAQPRDVNNRDIDKCRERR